NAPPSAVPAGGGALFVCRCHVLNSASAPCAGRSSLLVDELPVILVDGLAAGVGGGVDRAVAAEVDPLDVFHMTVRVSIVPAALGVEHAVAVEAGGRRIHRGKVPGAKDRAGEVAAVGRDRRGGAVGVDGALAPVLAQDPDPGCH